MSDAFKNYNNLISGLNQADAFKDAGARAVAETKAKADDIGKTLGEVKGFLSGTHGAKSFVKDIKPILKKRAEALAKRAKEQIEAKVRSKASELQQRLQNTQENLQARVQQGKDAVEDRLSGEPSTTLDTPNTQGENPTQKEQPEENQNPEDDEIGEDAETEEFGDGATLKLTSFGAEDDDIDEEEDDFADWSSSWGKDTVAEGRAGTFSNPVANERTTNINPSEADSQVELPSGTLRTTTFDGTFPEGDGAVGAGDATKQALSDGIDKGLASQAEKQVAEKTAGKVAGDVAKTTAEEAGGEAGLGVLDAIPGLDVLGFIGGAIMTAIEAHRQRKAEREEEEGAGATPNQAVQVGVGGE